jgi:ribonucleoside-diphosphate reductase alpha chain
MEVIKRSGKKEKVSFDKITERISALCNDLDKKFIDPIKVAKDSITNMYDGITTTEIDILSSDICASKIYQHPDFNKLASRICVSSLQKQTSDDYFYVVSHLFDLGILNEEFYGFVKKYKDEIQEMFDYSRDYLFDLFGIKTLERSYLMRDKKSQNKIIERPQHLWMRVSIQIHGPSNNLALVKQTYDLLSQHYFTHATPTLFNSGTKKPQMSSCFLISCEDELESIFKTLSDMGKISKWAGGIGVHISSIRGKGSLIRGTNGMSDGIVPLCKVMESIGRYINQGGKRNGSIAVYMEPWHTDIMEFIELRKNTGDENLRARDLFLALWVPDLFMKRVKENGTWSLMCPDQCKGLNETYGEEFEELYLRYESEGKFTKQIKAMDIWKHILESQIETGMPYICYKDNINKKSNQMNIGIIKSSNLCAEIVEVSNSQETAVCNLGSICLPKFIENNTYNFVKLREITRVLTRNLNKIIDLNYYPTPETKYSNTKNRPIGIGVQGLADVYCILGLPFESQEAKDLNKKIFENIYFASLEESIQIAKEEGKYDMFEGSPFSKGLPQWALWGLNRDSLSQELDWEGLIEKMRTYGTRNSLLTALMPTASTSQIMRNCECFEPYSSNIYVRKTLAGEYIIVNEHLVKDLLKLGLWNKEIYDEILYFNGSIQQIKDIPENIKNLYKTAFEIKQVNIVRQAIDRGPFVDQTQSMNIFQSIPDFSKLSSSHFYGWQNGLKTGMYYLRTQPAVDPIKFGLDPDVVRKIKEKYNSTSDFVCPLVFGRSVEGGCDMCSA